MHFILYGLGKDALLQLVFSIELYIGAIIYCLHQIPLLMVMITWEIMLNARRNTS